MPINMIFYPYLLSQLSGKKDKEKSMKKNVKTACETAVGGKTNDSNSWGRLDTRFYSGWMKIRLLQ